MNLSQENLKKLNKVLKISDSDSLKLELDVILDELPNLIKDMLKNYIINFINGHGEYWDHEICDVDECSFTLKETNLLTKQHMTYLAKIDQSLKGRWQFVWKAIN